MPSKIEHFRQLSEMFGFFPVSFGGKSLTWGVKKGSTP